MAKIAIIGAGSVEFTRNILTDLCSARRSCTARSHLALHDIDAERLAYAERAANQVVERLDAGYTVSAHADRKEAFDGADYLINEIQVGGYDATVTDFEIPRRYGLRQTIADTIGIGGIMRGLRTIPVMIEMGNEMAELCPDGLLLNYTNPMAMVPWGIWAGSSVAGRQDDRRVPQRARHPRVPGRDRRRARGERRVPHRRVQPPVLRLRVPRPRRPARTSTRACARSSRPTPRVSGGASGSRSSGGSATSPPSRASTRASTCRGSCTTPTRSSGSAARSTSTSVAATRTSRSGRR